MKVTLIDYTGAGSIDPMYAARLLVYTKNTRLEQSADTRAKVAAMDDETLRKELHAISVTLRSSWEFCDFTFQITGVTRALTHQLVRTRTGSYAQQAQRVVDMSSFENLLPASVAANKDLELVWDSCMRTIGRTYATLSANGVPNQDCRGVLPTNVLTNIIAKFNLRTLADLLGKRKNLRAQGEYADVARSMEDAATAALPWIGPFLNPDRLKTPALDALLKEKLGDRSPVDVPGLNDVLKEVDALKATWG